MLLIIGVFSYCCAFPTYVHMYINGLCSQHLYIFTLSIDVQVLGTHDHKLYKKIEKTKYLEGLFKNHQLIQLYNTVCIRKMIYTATDLHKYLSIVETHRILDNVRGTPTIIYHGDLSNPNETTRTCFYASDLYNKRF